MVRENTLNRMEKVRRTVRENWEPGNQSRCKRQVFRRHIMKEYSISERTFWRYVKGMKRIRNNFIE